MKKNGFTYIEVMMAIAVFLILAVCVMKLNIAANKNINAQIDKQNMMMEAQKQLEKFKTTTANVGNYVDDNYQNDHYEQIDGYYVIVQSKNIDQSSQKLLEVTVRVRKDITDKDNEVVLMSHFYKN
ncbi:MAG: prepilin-type N-terminal cleavage/methylation domain-containing protein [Clostridium sp.]|uniref:type IV pilus modification PilV family protein n=1 Tax=Clostridium sp. TaxID=1506 RepID=UPI0039EAE05B